MPTVLRQDGFEFVINTNDHEPAHVHVYYAEEATIINLLTFGFRENYMRRKNARKALEIAAANELYLLRKWEDYHGD